MMLYLVNGITTYIPNLEFLASTNSYHPRPPRPPSLVEFGKCSPFQTITNPPISDFNLKYRPPPSYLLPPSTPTYRILTVSIFTELHNTKLQNATLAKWGIEILLQSDTVKKGWVVFHFL